MAHRYGSTVVARRPERVVTVGLNDHDVLLALGVTPVGVTSDEYGRRYPHAVWPWAQHLLGDAEPELLPFPETNFEAIAALRPDLIIGLYAGLTEDDYQKLSRIAPTVAQSGEHADYGTPWQVMTRTAGQALGLSRQADDLVAGVEQRFADARRWHPEFDGASAVYAGVLSDSSYYAETLNSARVGILTGLGFVVPEDLARLGGDQFYAEVSREQVELLDHDVLVWEIGDDVEARDRLLSDPLYRSLAVHREGRDVFVVDPDLAGAMALISVLSLPFVLDRLVPMLAAAVDGDPATAVAGS